MPRVRRKAVIGPVDPPQPVSAPLRPNRSPTLRELIEERRDALASDLNPINPGTWSAAIVKAGITELDRVLRWIEEDARPVPPQPSKAWTHKPGDDMPMRRFGTPKRGVS